MAPSLHWLYSAQVLALTRFIAMAIVGVWLGAMVFFTFFAGPSFFSTSMIALLGKPHAGAAAQIIIERYFELQLWCSILALTYFVGECVVRGKGWSKATFAVLVLLLGLSLASSFIVQPKMHELHRTMYSRGTPAVQRETARKSFGAMHGVSQVGNLIMLAGVLFYFWQLVNPPPETRFSPTSKFRSGK